MKIIVSWFQPLHCTGVTFGEPEGVVEHNKLPNTKGPAAIVWAHKSYTREILFFGVFDLLKIRNDILTFLRKGTSIQRNSKMVLSGGLPHRSHASSWESLVCISLSYLIAECRLLLLVFFGYSCFFCAYRQYCWSLSLLVKWYCKWIQNEIKLSCSKIQKILLHLKLFFRR